MTSALCWELDDRISVEYALRDRRLNYFCFDEICLTEVVPVSNKNTNNFFRAKKGRLHTLDCINFKAPLGPVTGCGISQPPPPPLRSATTPSLLGPSPMGRKRLPPRREELLQLARRTKTTPVLHPGTLGEVVEAWARMPPHERRSNPLMIESKDSTYEQAFRFVADLARDFSNFPDLTQIVHGAGTVSEGEAYYFVNSRFKFAIGEMRKSLCFGVPKTARSKADLGKFAGQDVTFFWRGEPAGFDLSAERKNIYIRAEPDKEGRTGIHVR